VSFLLLILRIFDLVVRTRRDRVGKTLTTVLNEWIVDAVYKDFEGEAWRRSRDSRGVMVRVSSKNRSAGTRSGISVRQQHEVENALVGGDLSS
jgi:hypothetical protein